MLFENRRSNAGLIIWGDIYELKALWTFIHRVQGESSLLDSSDDGVLMSLAYEIRHAFDRMRRKETRKWFGEDPTPIYGFDCIWPNILVQVGLLRAAMAFMPAITRGEQAVMYGLESTVANALENLLPGTGEQFLKAAASIGQAGEKLIDEKLFSRTCYFLTLTPAQRKKHLGAIFDSLRLIWARDNYLEAKVFESFTIRGEYPDFKW